MNPSLFVVKDLVINLHQVHDFTVTPSGSISVAVSSTGRVVFTLPGIRVKVTPESLAHGLAELMQNKRVATPEDLAAILNINEPVTI